MPYKTEKLKMPREHDARVKITEEHEEDIKYRYNRGEAIRSIAREYEKVCSRKAIKYILFPERLEIIKKQYKERRKDGRYYDRAKHTKAIRKHRRRKYKLLSQHA